MTAAVVAEVDKKGVPTGVVTVDGEPIEAGQTFTVRGEGGAVWEQDVPADGTQRRERFEEQLLSGRTLLILTADEVKALPEEIAEKLSSNVIAEDEDKPKAKRQRRQTTPAPGPDPAPEG